MARACRKGQGEEAEQWEFDGEELMRRREASINHVAFATADRRFLWPARRAARGPAIIQG